MPRLTRRPARPRLGTKKYARAVAAFAEHCRAVLRRWGGRPLPSPGSFEEWELDTPLGRLWVGIDARPGRPVSVYQRFDHPKRAARVRTNLGENLNPYSGKWNFHFSEQPADVVADPSFAGWWRVQLEWVMELPPDPPAAIARPEDLR